MSENRMQTIIKIITRTLGENIYGAELTDDEIRGAVKIDKARPSEKLSCWL